MSHCRPVNEIDFLTYGWIPPGLIKMYQDLSLEEFVLIVRNGSIEAFVLDDEYSDEEKLALSDQVAEVRETLVINGFIRPEMMTLSTPELYFALQYIVNLSLADDIELVMNEDEYEEIFFPYFMTNEDYENYDFNYERVESILNVLSNFLSEEELYEVVLDVMFMSDASCDKKVLEEAKKKLVSERKKLVPLLEQVYTML